MVFCDRALFLNHSEECQDFFCTVCCKVFVFENDFYHHYETHNLECDICEKTYSGARNKSKYDNHRLKRHGIKCDFCDQKILPDKFKKHYEEHTKVEEDLEIQRLEKQATKNLEIQELEDQGIKCEICNQKVLPEKLEKHMRAHSVKEKLKKNQKKRGNQRNVAKH